MNNFMWTIAMVGQIWNFVKKMKRFKMLFFLIPITTSSIDSEYAFWILREKITPIAKKLDVSSL